MKGCTEKDAILDFFVVNNVNCKRPKFQPSETPLSVFHNYPSNMHNFFEILILSQNFGSFASTKKGMDTFQYEMSM